MPTRVVIAGSCLLVLGVVSCRSALAAVRTRRWARGALRGLTGLLFLALAGPAGAVVGGLGAYQALALEGLAAAVTTPPGGPPRFPLVVSPPDQRPALDEVAGRGP